MLSFLHSSHVFLFSCCCHEALWWTTPIQLCQINRKRRAMKHKTLELNGCVFSPHRLNFRCTPRLVIDDLNIVWQGNPITVMLQWTHKTIMALLPAYLIHIQPRLPLNPTKETTLDADVRPLIYSLCYTIFSYLCSSRNVSYNCSYRWWRWDMAIL